MNIMSFGFYNIHLTSFFLLLKPYIPYADCILGTRSGWLDDCLQEGDSKDQHAEQEDMQREFSLGGALLRHS